MRIYDESWNIVESPDLEAGRLEQRERAVVHAWVVDVAEEGHDEVVAEYPGTGGMDVEWVVDVAEEGHWETRDESGAVVDFDGAVPDDLPRSDDVPDIEQYLLYRPYTPEELAGIEAEKAALDMAVADRLAAEAASGQAVMACSLMLAPMALTDEQAFSMSALIEEWDPKSRYEADVVRRFGGALYRCLTAHDAQEPWAPDVSPSLWKRVGEPVGGVWPWVQPSCREDAYMAGDEALCDGVAWVSEVDWNVWRPGVNGWTAEEPTER